MESTDDKGSLTYKVIGAAMEVFPSQLFVEIKSVEKLLPVHEAQILTYMKLSKIPMGLLINFNVPLLKDGVKRFKLRF